MSKAKRNDSQGRMRSGLETSEEAFLRQQFDQVSDYVERYPEDERQKRAMEWVMRNAEEYRRKWQQRIASGEAPSGRCPDCSSEESDPLLVKTTNSLHGLLVSLFMIPVISASASAQNPAITTRTNKAANYIATGAFDHAAYALERALRIEPTNPEL